MKTILCASVIVLTMAAGGCSSIGEKMDRNTIQSFQRGKTTRAQVEAALGVPFFSNIMPDGKRLALYLYSESEMNPSIVIPFVGPFFNQTKTHQQNLQVVYTKDGFVDDYEFTDQLKTTTGTLGRAKYSMADTPVEGK